MTQSDQTNDNKQDVAPHTYIASNRMLPKFTPIKPLGGSCRETRDGSLPSSQWLLHLIGGLNCVSNLFRPPLTDTKCASHRAHSNR